jgi:hypothetical protein
VGTGSRILRDDTLTLGRDIRRSRRTTTDTGLSLAIPDRLVSTAIPITTTVSVRALLVIAVPLWFERRRAPSKTGTGREWA